MVSDNYGLLVWFDIVFFGALVRGVAYAKERIVVAIYLCKSGTKGINFSLVASDRERGTVMCGLLFF